MKIVVFGVGQIYKEKKIYISKNDEIIAFLDNDSSLWGTQVDRITIYNPRDILTIYFDKVILMSDYALEMKKQLLDLGCERKNIIHYVDYFNSLQIESDLINIQKLLCGTENQFVRKTCLIITTFLGCNGGTKTAIYAAMTLRQIGYNVRIAAPGGDNDSLREIRRQGIDVIIYKNLSHASEGELFWINYFEFVVVNTLQMICCAMAIAKSRKVILWIHEPKEVYGLMDYWEEDIKIELVKSKINIYAVSIIARSNFLEKYFAQEVKLMPYGIPDECISGSEYKNRHLVFAIIGLLQERKGQDIFLDAVQRISVNKNHLIFKIIGKNLNDKYGSLIEKRVKAYTNVWMVGEMTHDEIIQNYQNIDIVVVSSREETMSIVATEAMMMGKVCIISDTSGMADYIKDYTSGLIFPSGDSKILSEKMMWCINNPEKLKKIGMQAREIYETYFSMDIFGKNLETALNS